MRVLVLCRITPGLLFPTFVACGWFRIPLARFATVSILAGAIYSSIVLTIVVIFGDLVLTHLGYWAWGLLILVLVVVAVRNSFKSPWSKATGQQTEELPSSLISVFKKYALCHHDRVRKRSAGAGGLLHNERQNFSLKRIADSTGFVALAANDNICFVPLHVLKG